MFINVLRDKKELLSKLKTFIHPYYMVIINCSSILFFVCLALLLFLSGRLDILVEQANISYVHTTLPLDQRVIIIIIRIIILLQLNLRQNSILPPSIKCKSVIITMIQITHGFVCTASSTLPHPSPPSTSSCTRQHWHIRFKDS